MENQLLTLFFSWPARAVVMVDKNTRLGAVIWNDKKNVAIEATTTYFDDGKENKAGYRKHGRRTYKLFGKNSKDA